MCQVYCGPGSGERDRAVSLLENEDTLKGSVGLFGRFSNDRSSLSSATKE